MLRALQTGEFTRVGGEQTLKVDVRVLAATNRDLQAAVAAGQFREDLFFRLNVVPLRAPALRERGEDMPLCAPSFVELACRENGMKVKAISDEAVALLRPYAWPGNVRELKNVVERLVILSRRDQRGGPARGDPGRGRRATGARPSARPTGAGVELPAEARACRCASFATRSSASTSGSSSKRTAGTSRAPRSCWGSSAPTCTRRCAPWACP